MNKIFFLFVFCLLIYSTPIFSATYTVNTTSDTTDTSPGDGTCADSSGNCSLRAAIQTSNAVGGSNTIVLPANTYTLTLAGTGEASAATGDLDVRASLTIEGAGASTTIVDGNSLDRVFEVPGGVTGVNLAISGITIRGGSISGGGAAIEYSAGVGGQLTITNCTITNNTGTEDTVDIVSGTFSITGSTFVNNTVTASSGAGMAITNSGVSGTITNCTFSQNTATTSGGGIFAGAGTLTVNNSTLSGNIAGSSGGGISVGSATITVRNTILNNNTGGNCSGTLTSGGNNIDSGTTCGFSGTGDLSSTDPLLNTLADNGGSTQTMSLQATSPALGAGSNSTCASTDQRGITRPQGTTCDIGAFEARPASVSLSATTLTFTDQAEDSTSTAQTVTLTNGGDFALSISSITITGDFSQTNDCGTSVAAQGTCTITVTFTPTDSGNDTGTITLTDNASDSPQTISLTGTTTSLSTQRQGGSLFGCGSRLVPGNGSMGGIFVLLFPLFGFWIKKKINFAKFFIFLILALLSSPAFAFSNSLSTEFFKPTVDDSDYFSVYSSKTLTQKNYHFGLWVDYAHRPYEVGNRSNFNRVSGLTDGQFAGHFLGSYGIFDWFNVGARIPVYFYSNIVSGNTSQNQFNLGDGELDLKFKLLDPAKHKIGISILPNITFPSATHAVRDFTGAGNFTGGAKIIVDGKPHERVALALNLGMQGRQTFTNVDGNKIGSALQLNAGVAVDIIKKKLKVIAENQVETSVNSFFKRATTPMEARLGLRYRMKNGININAGGGMGYLNGIGSPEFRALAGVTYTSGRLNEFTLKEPSPETFELKDEEIWDKTEIGQELKLRDKLYFDYNKAEVRPISKATLDKLALFLKSHPEFKKLRIEGHTCDLGSDAYNLKLSQRRAQSVDQYLVQQGVEASRLKVQGLGKSHPLVPNLDEAHREQNRRVLIFVEEK